MTNAVTAELQPEVPNAVAFVEGSCPWPRPAYAWYVVVVLLVSYGFAILDRTAIGLLVDPIKHDLRIDDSEIGLLQGLAFAICYTTFGLPLGYATDRWRRTPVMAIGITVWSAATMACGLARGFGALFIARIGVGIGEASVTPGSSSLIADYFPPESRAKAYGLWMLGSSLGLGMASAFAALAIVIANHLHASGAPWAANLKVWQITFGLIAAPGLMVAILFALTVREPIRRGVRVASDRLPLRPIWTALKNNRAAYFTLVAGAVLNVTCIYAYIGWMPTLFMRVYHWRPAEVGSVFALIGLPMGMGGAIVAGWTMSWLTKRGRRDAPIIMSIGHSLMTLVFGTAACLVGRPGLTLALNALVAITSTWSYAAAMTGLNQITPNELRGQVSALYTACTGLISMTVGSFLVGFLSDNLFNSPRGIAPSLASVYAACSLLGFIVLFLGRGAYASAEAKSRLDETPLAMATPSPSARTRISGS